MPIITSLNLGVSLFGRAPVFLAGIVAAQAYIWYADALRSRFARIPWLRNGGADLVLLLLLAGLGYLLRWVVKAGPGPVETLNHGWHVLDGVLWALVLLVLMLAPLRTKRLFSNRALATLGTLSYSIYILHVPIITFGFQYAWKTVLHGSSGGTLPSAAVLAVLALVCFGASELTYRFIERPFLVRKARIED
jgi:peptidoglycan/LPS O-acetylase OafA/YrhL